MTAERSPNTLRRRFMFTALLVTATISVSGWQPAIAGATSTSADFTFVAPAEGMFVAGTPIEFRDRSIGAAWVYWNFGDGSGSHQRNPWHAFTAGQHLITYSVCASTADCSTVSKYIQVAPDAPNLPERSPVAGERDVAPDAVGGFTATVIDAKTVRLAWTHSGQNLDTFLVVVEQNGTVEQYLPLDSHERWLLLTEMPTDRRYDFSIRVFGPAVDGVTPVSSQRRATTG